MDMSDGMSMGGGSDSGTPLNDTGVDFSNSTQAADFLDQILDDSEFQVDGNMYARNFWYGVVVLIGLFAIFNIIQKFTERMRLRAAAANALYPAKPTNIFGQAIATFTAVCREASYSQYTPISRTALLKVPPVGTIVLVVAHLAWVILLEFVNNDVAGAQHFTSLGVRAAWLGIAQVPLLILLAGKNSLIGLVSGVSYERLNVVHRWTSRILLFLVTLHVIFLHLAWNAYGLMSLEYSEDSCIPTGWAVYAILLWMNLSTLAPIRNWSYEFFVVQHIVTFIGFIVAVMYHLPDTALYSRVYIYIPIGLYFVDRLIRCLRYVFNNVRPARATLTAMEGGVTKVVVRSKQIKNWTPGSHVFLSIPRYGLGQSHPATIASIPTSHNGELVFILKGHKGFTNRLLQSATNSHTSLLKPTSNDSTLPAPESHLALLDGPYGGSHADFATFDTVLLISGSTGITFTLPLLLSLAHRASSGTKLPLKRLHFLWVVKNTSWTSWISDDMQKAFSMLVDAGIEVAINVFVTCDDKFTADSATASGTEKECGCACDKSLGPCCCVNVDDQDDSDAITPIPSPPMSSSDDEKNEKKVQAKELSKTSSSASSFDLKILGEGVRSRAMPCATFRSGRPDLYEILWEVLERAEGETSVAVCGPLGLNSEVRRCVVRCSDERGVHKGTGAQGVYLHCEGFGW